MTAIAHPFHIHDVQFYILDINGTVPPANMQGRKDVVLVSPMGGTVRFITKFEDFANQEVPYMYHCHMLSHEDDGMMGQFIVFDNATAVNEYGENTISLYPNPTSDVVSLSGLSLSIIEIYDTSGQLLETRKVADGEEQFNLANYPAGVYYLNISTNEHTNTYRILKIE